MTHVGQWDGTCRIVSKGGGVVEFVEKWRIMADNGEKWEFELFHVEHVEF